MPPPDTSRRSSSRRQRRRPAAATVALALALALTTACNARGELVAVYSVQRHGARNVLPKSSLLAESEATGGPTLLPEGQRQCFEAGVAFARRYLDPAGCRAAGTCLARGGGVYGVVGQPGVEFTNWNTFANSSSLDRTLLSADAFLAGVFPATRNATRDAFLPGGEQLVPVYSVADSEDWRIRGYTKCPEYQRRLERWLAGSAFRQKERDSEQLRSRVQELAPQLNTSLANWWNVYDAFNVWRNYGVGDAMPEVDAATFNETVALAMWLETSKMAPELTGALLGGGLLGDLTQRLRTARDAVQAGSPPDTYYRLLLVSSHYNAQLGLLSALHSDPQHQAADYPWRSRIPALAAVLAFELHAPAGGGGDFAVRAVAQDGPAAQYQALRLPCAEAGDAAEALAGAGSCTLERFLALAEPKALGSSADWCAACDNSKVLACALLRAERQLAEVAGGGSGGGGGGSGGGSRLASPGMIALWCLVSAAAAALLAAAAAALVVRVRRARRAKAAAAVRLEGELGVL